MASNDTTTSTTRRAMLTGAVALTAALSVAGPVGAVQSNTSACASPGAWNAAFASWERASAAYNENADAGRDNVLSDAEHAAWMQLFTMPSPDRPSLLWKMEYLWGDDRGDDESSDAWSNRIVDAVMKDARRLLGSAA